MALRAAILGVICVSVLAAPAATAQTGFCDAFDPPMTGPQCPLMDDTVLPLVDAVLDEAGEAADLVFAIADLVYDYVWENSEPARCIVIEALGGSC